MLIIALEAQVLKTRGSVPRINYPEKSGSVMVIAVEVNALRIVKRISKQYYEIRRTIGGDKEILLEGLQEKGD